MSKKPWVIAAKKAGLDWSKLDCFDQIQWQKRYPSGEIALHTPVLVRAYPGHDRLSNYRRAK